MFSGLCCSHSHAICTRDPVPGVNSSEICMVFRGHVSHPVSECIMPILTNGKMPLPLHDQSDYSMASLHTIVRFATVRI